MRYRIQQIAWVYPNKTDRVNFTESACIVENIEKFRKGIKGRANSVNITYTEIE